MLDVFLVLCYRVACHMIEWLVASTDMLNAADKSISAISNDIQ
jgi:hypothetical protein